MESVDTHGSPKRGTLMLRTAGMILRASEITLRHGQQAHGDGRTREQIAWVPCIPCGAAQRVSVVHGVLRGRNDDSGL